MSTTAYAHRAIWLAVVVLGAVIAAVGAYRTLQTAGAKRPAALAASGATFVATITLGITGWQFLVEGSV